MSVITPDKAMVSELSDILDEVNGDYVDYLNENHQIDDIDFLAELLNEKSKHSGVPIRWINQDDDRQDPDEWISAESSTGPEGNNISVILWHRNLEDKWGPITFKDIVLKMISHETIHFGQYNKIGLDRIGDIESGHQKGLKLKAKTGKVRDWNRLYLRDPHELMAYGHDLSMEMNLLDDSAKALRNPEAFIDDLPVYKLFRSIFPRNAKPLQKLLSYTARYLTND